MHQSPVSYPTFLGAMKTIDDLKAVNAQLLEALVDVAGTMPDMVKKMRGVECRFCGRYYTPADDMPVPVDASECSDDCPGYIARAAIKAATEG